MIFSDIKIIKEFLKEAEDCKTEKDVKLLSKKVEAYFNNSSFKFESRDLHVNQFHNGYTKDYLNEDKAFIISLMNSFINQNGKKERAFWIYDLYTEGLNLENTKECYDYLKKVYNCQVENVKFDNNVTTILNGPNDAFMIFKLDYKTIKDGICEQLKNVCSNLLEEKSELSSKSNDVLSINISNNNSNNVSVDVSITYNEARKEIEELALSEEQTKNIIDKINELEEFQKNEKSKKTRWAKAKDFLKWVTEQGIQVAGVVLPLITGLCK